MNHLTSITDGAAKGFAALSVFGAITQEQVMTVASAVGAVIVTLLPHAIKAMRDSQASKADDGIRQHLVQTLKDRRILQDRCRMLEERIRELTKPSAN